MPKFLQILLVFFLTVSVSVNIYQFAKESRRDLHKVVDVIDGDTILIENSRKIRLAGVEAPETGLCGSTQSAQILDELVGERYVKIVPITTDTYGRDVATVYLGKVNINKQMISSGWTFYNSQDVPDREEVQKIHQQNQTNAIGIFSAQCTQLENPTNQKCNIKGNISKNTKIYFFPGCSSYQVSKVQLYLGERWFCSEKEAISAGFTKSTNCYGKVY